MFDSIKIQPLSSYRQYWSLNWEIVSSSTAIDNVVTKILNFQMSIFYAAVSDRLANEVIIFIDKTYMEELKVVKQRILSLKSIRNLNTSFERQSRSFLDNLQHPEELYKRFSTKYMFQSILFVAWNIIY